MANLVAWGLVPVKRFSRAKRRLGDTLSDGERARLAKAMLLDVLRNLTDATTLAGVAVVTADPEVCATARSFGAATIFDPSETGVNEAVQRGLDVFVPEPRHVLVVPADIPFAEPNEFDALVELLDDNHVVIAPALSDGGTNALAMRSADLIPPQFGEDSFAMHREAARKQGLRCGVLRSAGIGRDIDRIADFGPYLTSPAGTGHTSALVKELDLAERLSAKAAPAPLRLFS
jgi:2-phospho-L-lactate/phosphoenolpyruvate guanylyltransferase